MKELYILRHGIAVEPGTPGIPDDQRPLTPKGEKRMRQIALALARLDLALDRIVTSPLPRARATAEIVADALALRKRLEISDLLSVGSSAGSIQKWLSQRTEDRLMIVGHNPAFSDLVTLLVTGKVQPPLCDLKKGGVAALARLSAGTGRYEISWIATPRLMRGLSSVDNGADD
jgi:phosphohistidine phosphatase